MRLLGLWAFVGSLVAVSLARNPRDVSLREPESQLCSPNYCIDPYASHDDMLTYVYDEEANNEFVEVIPIGTTFLARSIVMLHYKCPPVVRPPSSGGGGGSGSGSGGGGGIKPKPKPKPARKLFTIYAGAHGSNWCSTAVALYLFKRFSESGMHPCVDLFALPQNNPDGAHFTKNTIFTRFMKNRNPSTVNNSCVGTALESNFGPKNSSTESDLDSDPCDTNYEGLNKLSELETQAVDYGMTYALNNGTHRHHLVVSVHSDGGSACSISFAHGHDEEDNEAMMRKCDIIAAKMAEQGFPNCQSMPNSPHSVTIENSFEQYSQDMHCPKSVIRVKLPTREDGEQVPEIDCMVLAEALYHALVPVVEMITSEDFHEVVCLEIH